MRPGEAAVDTQKILKDYISHELLNGRQTVDADDDLLGEGLIDSLGAMQFVAFIEDTFELKVPLEDITIQNFRTIESIDRYLQQRKPD